MMPALSPMECEELHTAFLKDIKAQAEKSDADIFVCFTPEEGKMKLENILGQQKAYFPQAGENLGVRMHTAIECVLNMGYEKCLLMGTDVPEIKAEYLAKAFDELDSNDIVYGRTKDGGYYLVGMKKAMKEVFDIPSYGHANVWQDTMEHLSRMNLSVGFTQEMFDMDDISDLDGYRRRMADDAVLKNSETGRFLDKTPRISVIIPIYNEEKTIESLMAQLEPFKDKCEIIFADGGSRDKTRELMGDRFRVIDTAKGRANQMNEAAKVSCGNILFFLHCDSEFPKTFIEEIKDVMKKHRAGCFGIAFHSWDPTMLVCRVVSNHRIKDRKVMFGDQGIFIERDLFFEIGMYPSIPIMEDYQLSLTLKEKKIKLGIAKHRIYTSPRRFGKGFFHKVDVMWKMNRLRKMYRDGVDIQKISDMYRDIR